MSNVAPERMPEEPPATVPVEPQAIEPLTRQDYIDEDNRFRAAAGFPLKPDATPEQLDDDKPAKKSKGKK